MVTAQLRKVGNSLVVTVPKSEVDRLALHEGDFVAMELSKMELKPVLNPELQAILDTDLPILTPMIDYLKDR